MPRRIVLLALLILLPSVAFGDVAYALRNVRPGEKVPDVLLSELEGGKEAKLSTLAGEKGAVVVFFATWSPRSMELLAFLRSRAAAWEKEGLKVVAVNSEKESLSAGDLASVRDRVNALGLPFPAWLDRGLSAYGAVGVISTPTTLLLRKDLTLVEDYPGFPSVAKDEIPERVEAFLGRKPAGEAKGVAVAEKVPRNHALMYYNLGKRLFLIARSKRTGKLAGVPEGAVLKLDEAAARDPSYLRPKILKAIVFHLAGQPERRDEALAALGKEGLEDPGDRRLALLAYLYMGMGEKAAALLPALEGGVPGDPAVPLARGVMAARKKDGAAVAAAVKALQADPRARELLGEDPAAVFATGYAAALSEARMEWALEKFLGIAPEGSKAPTALPEALAPAPAK
jgi:peroxiredoxin